MNIVPPVKKKKVRKKQNKTKKKKKSNTDATTVGITAHKLCSIFYNFRVKKHGFAITAFFF